MLTFWDVDRPVQDTFVVLRQFKHLRASLDFRKRYQFLLLPIQLTGFLKQVVNLVDGRIYRVGKLKKLQMRTLTPVFLVVSRIVGGVETADR
jgi:hypothetical protein